MLGFLTGLYPVGFEGRILYKHLEAVHPEEAAAPTHVNAQSVLGRRAHADGGPSSGVSPSARNTRARSLSQESGASVGCRHTCRRNSRRSEEEKEERGSLVSDLLC